MKHCFLFVCVSFVFLAILWPRYLFSLPKRDRMKTAIIVTLGVLLLFGGCHATLGTEDGERGEEGEEHEKVMLSIQDLVTPSRHYQPDDPGWHERWLARGFTPYIFFDGEVYRIVAPHSQSVVNSHDYIRDAEWIAISRCMNRHAPANKQQQQQQQKEEEAPKLSRGDIARRRMRKTADQTRLDRKQAKSTNVPESSPGTLRCPPEFEDGFMRSISVTSYPSRLMDVDRFVRLVRNTHTEVHHVSRPGQAMPLRVHETTEDSVTISMLGEWSGSAQTSVWHYRRGHALGISVTFHISMRYNHPEMLKRYKPYMQSKIDTWLSECERVASWLIEENDVPVSWVPTNDDQQEAEELLMG